MTPGVTSWALWRGRSADRARVFLVSTDKLTDEDLDAAFDVYMAEGGELRVRADGKLSLVSPGSEDEPDVTGHAVSADFSRVLFGASAQLTSDDGDSAQDVFLATLVAAVVGCEKDKRR